jgi:hypothetical protein
MHGHYLYNKHVLSRGLALGIPSCDMQLKHRVRTDIALVRNCAKNEGKVQRLFMLIRPRIGCITMYHHVS